MNQNEILTFCRKSVNFGFYSLAFFSAISISATQIALSIILLSWIILMVIEKRLIFAQTPLNYPFLIYFCIVIIAALLGIDFSHSAKAIHKLWITLTFFAMLTFIEDIRMVKRLIYILLITTSIVSVYGVLQHIFPGLDIARPEGRKVVQWTAEGGVASTGFFDHHMTFGGFLLLVFSLSFSLSLSRVQQIVKNKQFFPLPAACCLLPTILIFAGLISSMTRNAWMGALFAIIFIAIFKIKRKIISISALLLIFLLIPIILNILNIESPFLNRFKSIFNISANIERLYIWKGTIDMIMEHPLGVGMDNYSKAINDYRGKYSHKFSDGSDAHAHNTILTQAAEHGIFGLAAFLWIWIVFFREGVKLHLSLLNTPNSEPHTSIILGGLGAVAGFHLAGMFENNFGDAEVATMMWFIVGLIFLMRKINVNPNLKNV
ncbi:MAG: O-antigen ligase family protein [Nitrospinae bacterium]|nr:O-antigen ligase family protein [Nitrospinota bacterium]